MGGPYPPKNWGLGGANSRDVDIPVTSVLLVLYFCGALMHLITFQLNRRRGHKFFFNTALTAFCMSRVLTCTLRLASITHPKNLQLAIAAAIFVAAGVIIIFVINLLFTQRIVRSVHPNIGWHPAANMFLKGIWVLIGITFAMLIVAVVQSFYTQRPRTLFIDRALQLYGSSYLAFVATLPIFILAITFALPRKQSPDPFGRGRMSTKVAIVLTSTVIVAFGAWYRCGTSYRTPVPRTEPLPSYFHKAAFYVADFAVEIVTVYMLAAVRIDLRFYIPDGAKGPGSYSQRDPLQSQSVDKEGEFAMNDVERSAVLEQGKESNFVNDSEQASAVLDMSKEKDFTTNSCRDSTVLSASKERL